MGSRSPVYLWVATSAIVAIGCVAGGAEDAAKPGAAEQYAVAAGFYNRGLYQFAAEEYRSFLKQFPSHADAPRARLYLAKSLARADGAEEAHALLEGMAASDDAAIAAESALELGRLAFEAKRFEEAAAHYTRARDEGAAEAVGAEAALGLAECAFHSNDTAGAEALYREILKKEPKGRRAEAASYGIAWCRLRQDDFAGAGEAFGTFVQTFRTSALAPDAALLRADCTLREKKWKEAAQRYAEARSAYPAHADRALFGEGRAYFLRGDARSAAKRFAELIRKHPDSALSPQAVLALAEAQLHQRDYGGVLKTLDEATLPKGVTLGAEALFYRGRALLGTGAAAEAVTALERARAALPGNASWKPELELSLAEALGAAGRYGDAEKLYERLRAKGGASGERIALGLARTLHAAGAYKRSLDVLREAGKASAGKPTAEHIYLEAENLFMLGSYDEAEKTYLALQEAHKRFRAGEVSLRLVWCAYHQGRAGDAYGAVSKLRREKHMEPFREEMEYLRGLSAYAGGNAAGAHKSFKRAYDAGREQGRFRDRALFYRGKCAASQGLSDEARKDFVQYLAEYPEGGFAAHARLELAGIAMRAGAHDEAQRAYVALLGEDVPDIAPYALFGLAGSLYRAGKADEAAARYKELRDRFSGHELAPRALLGQARARAGTNPEEALALYRAFLESHGSHPEAFDAHLGTVRALRAAGRAEDALTAVEACLKGIPAHDDLWKMWAEKAEVLSAMGRANDAIAAHRTIREKFRGCPYAARSAYALAQAAFDEGKPSEALSLFREAGKLDRDGTLGAPLQYSLALAYWKTNRAKDAEKVFSALIEAHPATDLAGRSRVLRAEILFEMEKYEEATTALEEIAGSAGDIPFGDRALLRLADSYAKASRWKDAFARYRELLKKFPDSPLRVKAHYGQGYALQHLGRFEKALAAYSQATASGPGETAAKARFMAGQCYFHMGEFERAAKESLKVAALVPEDPIVSPALLEAGKCFEKLKRFDRARELYEEIIAKDEKSEWAATAKTRLAALETQR